MDRKVTVREPAISSFDALTEENMATLIKNLASEWRDPETLSGLWDVFSDWRDPELYRAYRMCLRMKLDLARDQINADIITSRAADRK